MGAGVFLWELGVVMDKHYQDRTRRRDGGLRRLKGWVGWLLQEMEMGLWFFRRHWSRLGYEIE